MFVSSNVFAITIEEVEKMGPEKAMQYLVKKYKAKNWDDLLYNTTTTNRDKDDLEVIKLIKNRIDDMKILSRKALQIK